MNGTHWHITTEKQRKNLIAELLEQDIGEHGFLVKIETGKRTSVQNDSMHLYFRLLAETLCEAGLDIRRTLKQDFDIPWTEKSVKELIWLPVMTALTGKTSTTKLDRKEVGEIFDVINRHLAETHAVMCSFPNKFGD